MCVSKARKKLKIFIIALYLKGFPKLGCIEYHLGNRKTFSEPLHLEKLRRNKVKKFGNRHGKVITCAV